MNFPGKSISTLGTIYQGLQDLEKRRYLEKTRPKVKITTNPITIGIPITVTEPYGVSTSGRVIPPRIELARITQELMKQPDIMQLLSVSYRNPQPTENWILAVKSFVSSSRNPKLIKKYDDIVRNSSLFRIMPFIYGKV